MPSGGGGFGGGGGGGGGGFGGGHYHGGSGSGGGGGPGTIIIAVVVTFIVIMIVLMVRFTSNVNLSEDTFYSPGDTRLIELNTLFCKKITLSESSFFTDANLFLLTNEEIPSITDRNNFTITGEFVIGNNEFQFWQYHLYRNSNVTISACIPSTQGTSTTQGVSLFVIKGNDNYASWKVDGSSSHAYYHSVVDRVCNRTNSDAVGLYNVTNVTINEEDEWYVAFASFDVGLGNVSVELFFERFQYSTESLASISETCSTSSDGDCSLDVGFRSDRKYGLIVTSIPDIDDIDWGENVDVDWSCSRNHGGYFLVTGVPIFGLMIIIALVIGGIIIGFCVYDNLDKIKSCCRRSTPSANTRRPVPLVFAAAVPFKQSSGEPNDVPEEVLRMQAGEDGPPTYTTNSSNPPPYDAKHNYFQ